MIVIANVIALVIVVIIDLVIIAIKIAAITAYNLGLSRIRIFCSSFIKVVLITIGVKTAIGTYFIASFIKGGNSFGIIEDNAINLVKNVKIPQIIIRNQIIIFF